MTKNESTATITINIATTFTVDEIWPDGDAPSVPTAADVAAIIARDGGASVRVIRDWCMEMDWTWTVDVNAREQTSSVVVE